MFELNKLHYAEAPLPPLTRPKRVMLLGASGTAGQATLRALLQRGHHVTCFLRGAAGAGSRPSASLQAPEFAAANFRFGDVTQSSSLKTDGFREDRFDALVSCLASRTGAPADAWAIDHQAHAHALQLAKSAGVQHMVLLSAICVQKPRLAFQFAKLAFEKQLMESGLTYSIVRPTAFFKSLSGQIGRLRAGKSFLVFGDGTLTACKPISDRDLGRFLVRCLDDLALHNRILPVGGPGDAITPRQQGDELFKLLGQKPRFRHVPVGLLNGIIAGLSVAGRLSPAAARKAELARIGHYYATESMLHFDPSTGRYNADATPSFGSDHLFTFYSDMIASQQNIELGDHAVF